MATYKCEQLLQSPAQADGKERALWWEFNAVDDGGVTLAQNDKILLGVLPAGARLTGGKCIFGAFGAAVTGSIGLRAVDGSGYLDIAKTVADDPDKLWDGVDISAAGESATIAGTVALSCFYTLEKACYVEAILEDANPEDTSQNFNGYISYSLD